MTVLDSSVIIHLLAGVPEVVDGSVRSGETDVIEVRQQFGGDRPDDVGTVRPHSLRGVLFDQAL